MSAIDCHAHVVVPELLRESAPAEEWRPAIRVENGHEVVELGGKRIASARHPFVDPDAIISIEAGRGVDRVLLCPWVPLLFYDVDPQEGLRRCRLQNEGLLG